MTDSWLDVPTPSADIDAVGDAAKSVAKAVTEIDGYQTTLGKLVQEAAPWWSGTAGTTFVATGGLVVGVLGRLSGAYGKVAGGLDSYHRELGEARDAARTARGKISTAVSDYVSKAQGLAASAATVLEKEISAAAAVAASAAAAAGGGSGSSSTSDTSVGPGAQALLDQLRGWAPPQVEPRLVAVAVAGYPGGVGASQVVGAVPGLAQIARRAVWLEDDLGTSVSTAFGAVVDEGTTLAGVVRSVVEEIEQATTDIAAVVIKQGESLKDIVDQIRDLPGVKQILDGNELLHATIDPLDSIAGWLATGNWAKPGFLHHLAKDAVDDAKKDLKGAEDKVDEALSATLDVGRENDELIEKGLLRVDDVKNLEESFGDITSAAEGVKSAESDVAAAVRASAPARGLLRGLDATAIVGDAITFIDPEDPGTMGWVDRGAAAANGIAAGAELAETLGVELAIPEPAGGLVIAGTGIYFAADYAYHNWKWFHDRVDDVGHAAADVGKEIAKGAVAVALNQHVVQGAEDTAHVVDGAAKAVANVGDAAFNVAKKLF